MAESHDEAPAHGEPGGGTPPPGSPAGDQGTPDGAVADAGRDAGRAFVEGEARILEEPPGFDHARIEKAVREILIGIGEDPDRDGLRDTPARVARAYAEQFAGLRQTPEDALTTVFDADHEEMVLVKDIEVYSVCEHHLFPLLGFAHVVYTTF